MLLSCSLKMPPYALEDARARFPSSTLALKVAIFELELQVAIFQPDPWE